MFRHLRRFSVWLIGLSLLPGVVWASVADDEPESTITVTGTGRISAAPDTAEINVGVITQAPKAQDALQANNEAMATLIRQVSERGVASKDIQTTRIEVQPRYSQPRPRGPGAVAEPDQEFVPRIVAYQVTNTVHVRSRDLGKLGVILDAVVQAGANQIYGISFGVDNPEKLLDEARKRAVADAGRKARQLADEAGVVLGSPLRIAELGGIAPTPPILARGRAFAMESAVPVSPGEQEMSVSVQVIYRIAPPR
jgi:hypothetical protein